MSRSLARTEFAKRVSYVVRFVDLKRLRHSHNAGQELRREHQGVPKCIRGFLAMMDAHVGGLYVSLECGYLT